MGRAKKEPEEGAGPDLLAVMKGDEAFNQLLQSIGRTGRHVCGEKIKDMQRKQLVELCDAVEKQVTASVQTIADAPEPQNEEEQEAAVAQLDQALQVLHGAAVLAIDILKECHTQPPESLHNTAVLLHDNCLLALDELPNIQDPVAKLCCSWWELNAVGKEGVVAQTLPFLLMRANAAGRAMDVKACYTLREAFNLLDFDDPSSTDVKRLLLQTAMHPAFLHRPEGRKFIAFVFRLHMPFVREMTAIIKNQIPGGRKSVLDAYGDIIFRAWKDSVGSAFQYELEAACIQTIMQAAIMASSPPLAAALRTVLNGLHTQKKVAGVDSMLARLYEPILFRCFAAANTDVRRNALLLLLDAFPIQEPDAAIEEVDEAMTNQFKLLQDCMMDDCPMIREAAVRGVIKLLNMYWELIPAPAIAVFVTKLTGDIAFDMAWPGVRAAVLENLTQLVDNPHAQPVLKKALPSLATLLADPVLKVREAMANLLVAVSRTRALHFYEVVPIDSLLAVMATDVPVVSHKIQSILVPSYFSSPEEGSARVAMLLRTNPSAGQAFCQYLVSSFRQANAEDDEDTPLQGYRASVPIEHILTLAGDLKNHLLATCTELIQPEAKPSRKKQKSGKNTSKKKAATGKRRKQGEPEADGGQAVEGGEDGEGREEEAVEEEVVVDDEHETPASWSSVAAGLAQICTGLAAAVQQEQCGSGDVETVFEEDALLLMLEACPTDASVVSVLKMATALPFMRAASEVRGKLFSALAAERSPFPNAKGDSDADVMGAVLSCLCAAPSGAKLVAMVLKSMGLRPSGIIHVPVGNVPKAAHEHEDEESDDVRCHACDSAEHGESMLLCDGCDAAYHMGCLRPTLAAIPSGDWFCHACETELRACTMSAADGIKCLSAILEQSEGRQLVHSHKHFGTLLSGLKGDAHKQAQILIRQLTHSAAAAAPAAAGKASKGRGKKAAVAAAADVAPAEQAGVETDTHAAAASAVSNINIYCKAALHLVLTSLMPSGEEDEGTGEDKAAALATAAAALVEAQEMCEQVMEACVESAASPAVTTSALRFAADVLGVLVDAQHLGIFDLSRGGQATQVQRVCNLGAHITSVCTRALEAQANAKPAAAVKDVYSHMLVLSKQLVYSLARPQGAGNLHTDGTSQQLEALLNNASDVNSGEVGALLDGLVQHLLAPVMGSHGSGLVGMLRGGVTGLMATLMDRECKVTKGWMAALMGAVGTALASADLAEQEVGSPAEGVADGKARGRSGRRRSQVPQTNRRQSVAVFGEEDDEGANGGADVGREGDQNDAAGVGGPGGDEDVQEKVNGPAVDPAAAALSEADPAASTLTSALLGLARVKQLQDPMLDQLADMAVEGWRTGNAATSLGALAVMSMLGVKGLRSRRLRLTGCEANALIKLEMLAEDVHAAQAATAAIHEDEAHAGADAATAQVAGQAVRMLQRVM